MRPNQTSDGILFEQLLVLLSRQVWQGTTVYIPTTTNNNDNLLDASVD